MIRLLTLLAVCLLASGPVLAESVQMQHKQLQINAELVKAAGEWPAKRVVLLTHGTLAHGKMEIVSSLQSLLAENDVASLAPTLSLGINNRQGMYDCAMPHTHRHADALEEIGAWVDWLKYQGVEEVVLMGHSRGGNQTAWFAAKRDDKQVSKIVLLAPMTWNADSEYSSYKERYKNDIQPLLSKAESMMQSGKGDTMLSMDFIYCPKAQASAKSVVSYYKDDKRRDTPALLTMLNKPVLLITGSEDNVVKNLDNRGAKLAQQGVIEHVEIEGADHFFRDIYAEEVVEGVVAFLDK